MQSILVIYTGGTIGMEKNKAGVYAATAGFEKLVKKAISKEILKSIPKHNYLEINPAIDSSCMTPKHWEQIAKIIVKKYDYYSGFIVCHGTDTMAYTASALSFLLGNLDKTVIVTGSQIPLTEPCSDGAANLLISLQLIAKSKVPEVCVYFANQLFRGNRVTKVSSSSMIAFESTNYPALATFENKIKLHKKRWLPTLAPDFSNFNKLKLKQDLVAIIYITPGMPTSILNSVLSSKIKGLVLVSYGSGNVPFDNKEFIRILTDISKKGIVIVNVSQCLGGDVQETYEAGSILKEINVISGRDMTIEAAMTKLYYLLSSENDIEIVKEKLTQNLRGEISL